MRITKCIISKAGLFDNITFEFKGNKTQIYGKNGSGKTILAKSIIDTFYKKIDKTSILPENLASSLFFEIYFEFDPETKFKISNNGNNYYKIYSYKKNEEVLVYSHSTLNENKIVNQDILQQFESFFNEMHKQYFIDLSYAVAPSDVPGKNPISYNSIKEILLKENNSFLSYDKSLETSLTDQHNKTKIDEHIEKNQKIVKDVSKRLTLIDLQNARLKKLENENSKISSEIETLHKSLTTLENQKKLLLTIKGSIKELQDIHNNLETIKTEVLHEQQKNKHYIALKNSIKTTYPQFKHLSFEDTQSLDELQEVFIQIRNINEKIEDFNFNKLEKKKSIKRTAVAVNISAIMAIVTILIKNKLSFQNDIFLTGGILGFAILFTPVLLFFNSLKFSNEKAKKYNKEKMQLEEKLKEILERTKIELEGYKLSELYEFLLQYFEDYIEYTEQMKELVSLRKNIKDKQYLQNIKDKLQVLKNEEKKISTEIDEYILQTNIDEEIPHEISKIDNIIFNLEREIELLQKQITVKQNIINKIDTNNEKKPIPKDKVELLVQLKDNSNRKLDNLTISKNTLNYINSILFRTIAKREQKQLEALVKITLEKFHYLTDNHYITKVDEVTLLTIVKDNNFTDDFNPTMKHALLLSLKLALTNFLEKSELLIPLLIDDPFQFMDEYRSERLKELLDETSSKRQVIIFTHQRDIDFTENYLEL